MQKQDRVAFLCVLHFHPVPYTPRTKQKYFVDVLYEYKVCKYAILE